MVSKATGSEFFQVYSGIPILTNVMSSWCRSEDIVALMRRRVGETRGPIFSEVSAVGSMTWRMGQSPPRRYLEDWFFVDVIFFLNVFDSNLPWGIYNQHQNHHHFLGAIFVFGTFFQSASETIKSKVS